MHSWSIRQIRLISMPARIAVFTTPPTAEQRGTLTAQGCPMWQYLISQSVLTAPYVRRHTDAGSMKLLGPRKLTALETQLGLSRQCCVFFYPEGLVLIKAIARLATCAVRQEQ